MSHFLFIRALDYNLIGLGAGNLDAFRAGDARDMGQADLQGKRIAFYLGSKTYADDFEFFFVSFGNAYHHVGDEAVIKSMASLAEFFIADAVDEYMVILFFKGDLIVAFQGKRAFGSLDGNFIALERDFDIFGDVDGDFSYTRHCDFPPASLSGILLPDIANDLAADFFSTTIPVGQDALRG